MNHHATLLGSLCLLAACAGSDGDADSGAGASGVGASGVGASAPTVCETPLTNCDDACVDVTTDPSNCGVCGRTCVVPGAEAACVTGECAFTVCDDGLADCDGDINNGCELEVSCTQGGACTTSCDSIGSLECADACAPSCAIPVESCNVVDDDCDGVCDNGAIAGCRDGVHRASGPNGHFYGTDENEAVGLGYTIESIGYFYLYASGASDLQPLFRCNKSNGKPLLTTATDCEMTGGVDAVVGFISATEQCGAIPLYRLLNTAAGAHFYTTSVSERDSVLLNLGFADEGIAGYVWAGP
jgi:hypothetical protein